MDSEIEGGCPKNVKNALVLFKERDKIIYRTSGVDKLILKCKVEDNV
jgi:hypothetical protein